MNSTPSPGAVECIHLADGRLVRMAGMTGPDQVTGLRTALLAPLARGCSDVVLDAGAVTDVCEEALVVLAAAPGVVARHGGRFLLSRSSPRLDQLLADRGIDLPRLVPLPSARRTLPAVRAPRCSARPGPGRRPRPGLRSRAALHR
jgi:hypothetical protein